MIKAHKPKAQTAGAYPGFLSVQACLGVLLLSPERPPPQQYGTHFIHLGEVESTSLSKETRQRARLKPRTSGSRVRGFNRSAAHASALLRDIFKILATN